MRILPRGMRGRVKVEEIMAVHGTVKDQGSQQAELSFIRVQAWSLLPPSLSSPGERRGGGGGRWESEERESGAQPRAVFQVLAWSLFEATLFPSQRRERERGGGGAEEREREEGGSSCQSAAGLESLWGHPLPCHRQWRETGGRERKGRGGGREREGGMGGERGEREGGNQQTELSFIRVQQA